MAALVEKAPAKINLTLDVVGRRADGYHDVVSIMLPIELHDTVRLKESRGLLPGEIMVVCEDPAVPRGRQNLVYQAARLLMEGLNLKPGVGVEITIEKSIPMAAGLAGGSADAAAVLRGLNRMWKLGLSDRELQKLGSRLGADVPFCLFNRPALARGKGEVLTPIRVKGTLWFLLAKGPYVVATAEVYRRYDQMEVKSRPRLIPMLQALEEGAVSRVGALLCNVLEPVTTHLYPQVKELKRLILSTKCPGAAMSGSGPSVFGVARNEDEAREAADTLLASATTPIWQIVTCTIS